MKTAVPGPPYTTCRVADRASTRYTRKGMERPGQSHQESSTDVCPHLNKATVYKNGSRRFSKAKFPAFCPRRIAKEGRNHHLQLKVNYLRSQSWNFWVSLIFLKAACSSMVCQFRNFGSEADYIIKVWKKRG